MRSYQYGGVSYAVPAYEYGPTANDATARITESYTCAIVFHAACGDWLPAKFAAWKRLILLLGTQFVPTPVLMVPERLRAFERMTNAELLS
jgi:hypothetical protein